MAIKQIGVVLASAALVAGLTLPPILGYDPLPDLHTLNSDMTGFKAALEGLQPSNGDYISINSTFQQFENDLKTATQHVKDAQPFTQTTSRASYNFAHGTFKPNIEQAVTILEQKRAMFEQAGQEQSFDNMMQDLPPHIDAFGRQLIALYTSDVEAKGTQSLDELDEFIEETQEEGSSDGSSDGTSGAGSGGSSQ